VERELYVFAVIAGPEVRLPAPAPWQPQIPPFAPVVEAPASTLNPAKDWLKLQSPPGLLPVTCAVPPTCSPVAFGISGAVMPMPVIA
jgi:hypothetical protein